jgi:MFS family permease
VIASLFSFKLIGRLGRTLTLIGLAITLAGVAWFLALVLAYGTMLTAAAIAPAMVVVGLGMGAAFGTLYDVAIGDIEPAEAGSASGSLSAIQQLSNAIGPAVITTIYFGGLAGGQRHAMSTSLVAVAVITALSCLVAPLLPRKAQGGAAH